NALSEKSAKDKVVSAKIKDLGVTDLGEIKRNGKSAGGGSKVGYAPTLTYNEKALTIARYPNEGYLYTASIIKDGLSGDPIPDSYNAKEIEYTVADARLKKWAWKDVWNLGYFMHDWSDTTIEATYNAEKNSVISATSDYGVASDRRVYFFNVPEELDAPGEWYLDRETGVLYMIPVEGMKAEDTLVFNSFNKNFFELANVKNVSFISIKFNGTCEGVINAKQCDGIVVDDCEFTGIGAAAVSMSNCYRSGVRNSYFHDLGSSCITFSNNGDRNNLVSGDCFITNCHFEAFSQYRRTYSPAIGITNDVGTTVANCEIHDAPHFAIRFEANDNIIEYCDIYDVCQETADTGAIYTGRRWETRGNEVRYNYIHDMTKVDTTTGMKKMGVYLDDCSAGTRVHGNVFYKIDSVALMGGGRHNQFTNNIMISCNEPLVFDERGLTWSLAQQTAALEKVPYKEGVWAERYPELVNIMEDDPGYPKYNVLKNNVIYQAPDFDIYPAVQKYSEIETPVKLSSTRDFVDFKNENFTLKEDSEIFTKLPEFENIPFDKIGRYEYTVEDNYVEKGTAAPSAPADDTIKVLLNGTAIDFQDVAPQIINSRTMVPLRAIFEALGASVEWDDATKTVTAVKGDVTIKMTIGASSFTRNDESVALDSPATIVDSRTLVPVRAIAESFGSEVGWDGATKTVTITD
ncbi:MAG: stalk domain-containing protein, partial [Clostridia bacterium]|nr:stalk domain-containing protein [Clostridia bacterium]